MSFNPDIPDIISLTIGALLFLMVFVLIILSALEKEYYSVKKSIILLLFPALFLVIPFLDFPYQNHVLLGISGFISLAFIVLVLPFNKRKKIYDYTFSNKVDERDIMFSRIRLKEGSENHKSYYSERPENKETDERLKANPGLLSEGSTYYNLFQFASANASFETVEAYHDHLYKDPAPIKKDLDAKQLTRYLKSWSKKLGAVDCGITELKDYHTYSKLGRKHNYGNDCTLDHKYAIAFTVEMDKDMMAAAPAGSTVMESGLQYMNAGSIAMQLASFLRNIGYESLAHIDGRYEVIAPLVAKDAGLGELGRMGLLMTPNLGPRVRIGVVTTNAPLNIDSPTFAPDVIDFCRICKKCADCCPGKAISHQDREDINGDIRWQINQEECFKYWTVCGTDCGRCMAVCPYSHPNNLLHNFVRKGLKNSYLFRRFALKMDNFLYGRKPAPGDTPNWIKNLE
ncbi:MAG: hypothetical protein C0592_07970 [Marinilabiliales bacterium]|nr:MAG: hypothetical protein C0592_07970 [Marinilabiliales bacterium]